MLNYVCWDNDKNIFSKLAVMDSLKHLDQINKSAANN